jgi:predicted nucleic acid-binding protein
MVVDSSIFIEHLRAGNKQDTTLYSIADEQLYISSITLYELYMGATNETKGEDVKNIIDNFIAAIVLSNDVPLRTLSY